MTEAALQSTFHLRRVIPAVDVSQPIDQAFDGPRIPHNAHRQKGTLRSTLAVRVFYTIRNLLIGGVIGSEPKLRQLLQRRGYNSIGKRYSNVEMRTHQ